MGKIQISKELLLQLYVVEKKSIKEVFAIIGASPSTIRLRLLEYGLMRSKIDAAELAKPKQYILKKGSKHRPLSEESKLNMSLSAIKRWDGRSLGISLKPNGYYETTTGENKGKSVHVVTMEKHIGRKLTNNEVVHHINEIKTDNRIENLQLMTKSEHCTLHAIKNNTNRIRNKKGQFV